MWVTLALTVGGGYFLAPYINQEVQRETLRREFLVRSLDALSGDTISLITAVNKQVAGDTSPQTVADTQAQIVELQYKLVQLNISSPARRGAAIEVQRALARLQTAILDRPTGNRDAVRAELESFSTKSFELYDTIIRDTGLL